MTRATVSADGETITVHIPMTFRKRGGRKLVVTPDGAAGRRGRGSTTRWSRRWRGRFGGGRCWTTGEYATLEDLAGPRACRHLRQPDLAADAARAGLVEAILDGRQPAELQLDDLLEGFPLGWEVQRLLVIDRQPGVAAAS